MPPIDRSRSADGHLTPGTERCAPFSTPAATLSLPLASTTRGRHSQTDNEHDPSPSSTSIRALAPRRPTTGHDVLGIDIGAVESDLGDRPHPARGMPSSA
jgi:hypothetical protein